ncbi:MAG: Gfo/Idh/MocA family oxidoreductase [bacterium]
MDKKLRIGIVGASGWMAGALIIGSEYDEMGFDLETKKGNKSSISVVKGLCDLNKDILIAKKNELCLDEANLFTSYDELLSCQEIDAVIIAVPNNLHAQFTIKALKSGKHVFLEKPFSTTYKDSQELLKISKENKLTTKVDYILVHYDEQQKLKELINQNAFGEIASTHFTYRHPIQVEQTAGQTWKLSKEKSGGAIPMGICHAISLTVFQVNKNPITVISKSNPAKIRNFDYDTQYDIMIIFENNIISIIQGNIDFAEKYDARHTIIGTNGQFDYNPYNSLDTRVMWSSKTLQRNYSPDSNFAQHHLDSGNVWKHQCGLSVREFVKYSLNNEEDPLLGFNSPLVKRTEAIIWAAEESAFKNGMPVDVKKYFI